MKFVLFVEGWTERKAVPSFLRRWLDLRPGPRIGVKCVKFNGWADYQKEIQKKVELHLTGKGSDDVIAAIGLLDLYGPTFFPADKKSSDERYAWGKAYFEKMVGHERFRQHFAVHETEAWLLAEPNIHPNKVARALQKMSKPPEKVNFDKPPARFLDDLYRQHLHRGYGKITDGVGLFDKLKPEAARQQCPYFAALLTDLATLASEAT